MTDSEARDRIQAEYSRYCAAFVNKDIDGIRRLLAPGFVWKSLEGDSLDLSQSEAAILEQMAATVSVDEMTADVESITLRGDSAVVFVRERLTAVVKGENEGLEHLTSLETYRDTWIDTAYGWRFLSAETLTSEAFTKPL